MKPLDAPQRALCFDGQPPLSTAMRYFLSAPLFAALAAGLLAWQGEAAVVHACLCAGTLALAAAFWQESPTLFRTAMALLLPGLLLFAGACTVGMWQQHLPGSGAVVAGVRLSLAALLTTITLGGMLASAFAWPGLLLLPLQRLTDLHAMWGLLGWVGLLVIGVAFQVVPMFMLTAPYPAYLTGSYATWMFMLLCAASLSSGWTGFGLSLHHACLVLLAAGYALFAGATLYLLARRKRPRPDPAALYWRTAMACLLAALALAQWPATASNAAPLATGVLLIPGFALSAIIGMLYKIVPFLTWQHMQGTRTAGGRKPPGLSQIIPERLAQWQYGAHLTALLLLLAACHQPALARPAAALMCLSCLALCLNLGRAVTNHIFLIPVQP